MYTTHMITGDVLVYYHMTTLYYSSSCLSYSYPGVGDSLQKDWNDDNFVNDSLKKQEEQTEKEEDETTPLLTDSRYYANFNCIVQMILVVDAAGLQRVHVKYQ